MAPKKRTRLPDAAAQRAATPPSHDSRSGEPLKNNTSNRAPSSRRAPAAAEQMTPQASASTSRPRKGTRFSTSSGSADGHAPQTSQCSSSGLSHRPGLAPRTVIFANVQEAVAAARKDCTDGGGEPKMAAPHGNPMVFCWTTGCPFQRYVQVVEGPEVPPLWGVTKSAEHDHTAAPSSSSGAALKVTQSKGKAAQPKAAKGRSPPARAQVGQGGKSGQKPASHRTPRSGSPPGHATSSGRARGGRASAPSPVASASQSTMSSSSKQEPTTALSNNELATPQRRRARPEQASQQEKGGRSPSPSKGAASAAQSEVMHGSLAPSSPLPPPFYPCPPAPPPFYPVAQQAAGPLSPSSSGSSSGESDSPSKARRRRRARLARTGSERAASI